MAGLSNDHSQGGRPPRLTGEQKAELAEIVRKGPDRAVHGVVRWRRIDLQAVIRDRFAVELAERTIGTILHELGFRRLSPRPSHPKKDEEAQEAFKKTSQNLPPRDCRYPWAYIFGAVCPARETGAALVLPTVNTQAMSLHLAEISRQVAPGAHAILILDGAGWHKTGGALAVPDNITLLPLPPYAPELNPVENIWQYLRQNDLCHIIWESYEAIVEACCDAWNKLTAMPHRIRSIASRQRAEVNV